MSILTEFGEKEWEKLRASERAIGYEEGYEEGFQIGLQEGRVLASVRLIEEGSLSIEEAARIMKMTIHQFKEQANELGCVL